MAGGTPGCRAPWLPPPQTWRLRINASLLYKARALCRYPPDEQTRWETLKHDVHRTNPNIPVFPWTLRSIFWTFPEMREGFTHSRAVYDTGSKYLRRAAHSPARDPPRPPPIATCPIPPRCQHTATDSISYTGVYSLTQILLYLPYGAVVLAEDLPQCVPQRMHNNNNNNTNNNNNQRVLS